MEIQPSFMWAVDSIIHNATLTPGSLHGFAYNPSCPQIVHRCSAVLESPPGCMGLSLLMQLRGSSLLSLQAPSGFCQRPCSAVGPRAAANPRPSHFSRRCIAGTYWSGRRLGQCPSSHKSRCGKSSAICSFRCLRSGSFITFTAS